MDQRLTILAVAALLVTAGCAAPMAEDAGEPLEDDELGVVNGYAYDDELDLDWEAGLTQAELEAVTYRAMARLEVLRERPFERDVDVEVMDRETARERFAIEDEASAAENEFWRAAFVVDEETDVNEARGELLGEAVAGFYTSDRIVIVVADTDRSHPNRDTLVHELVHALQDQHFGLDRPGETWDAQLANGGILEGEADYLPIRYAERCDVEWQCIPPEPPEHAQPDGPESVNVGLLLALLVQYAEGVSFVAELYDRGGWAAVDAAHAEKPTSTSQLIHHDRYPDHEPRAVAVPDESTDAWVPMTEGENGEPIEETVGEGTLFAALYGQGVVDRSVGEGATPPGTLNYSYPATDGWEGDTLVAYERADGETAHVWYLEWSSEGDAAAFADAYRAMLAENDAIEHTDGLYEIETPPFAGAYSVSVEGDRVAIVNAPTVAELGAVHEPAAVETPTAAVAPGAMTVDSPVETTAGGSVAVGSINASGASVVG